MVDFVTALKAGAAAVSAVKDLAMLEKEYDKAALKLKIAELSSALATVQLTLTEAQAELAGKDAEIARLQQSFKRKNENTIEHHGYTYEKHADGKPVGLPYCPRCLDKGTLMRMTNTSKKDVGRIQQCPECKSEYRAQEWSYR